MKMTIAGNRRGLVWIKFCDPLLFTKLYNEGGICVFLWTLMQSGST